MARRPAPDVDALVAGVLAGDRGSLGRAITLVESSRALDREPAARMLGQLAQARPAQSAYRVGITGVPGVGKSTFIESLGLARLAAGHSVAVLAVDPSSQRSGGSILGDKTRMPELSRHERAFVRPSPAGTSLGGVARRTREVIAVCEAAGFDFVIVETVGVGQSEHLVSELVDCFLLLMLAGAGDELQGIKRGILELADLIVVQKADGDNVEAARRAAAELRSVSDLMRTGEAGWSVPVLTSSAVTGAGLDQVWATVLEHRTFMAESGAFEQRRRRQAEAGLDAAIEEGLRAALTAHPQAMAEWTAARTQVADGLARCDDAARKVVATLLGPG